MAFTLDGSKVDNLFLGQTGNGGMRTTSTMQRPGDVAANLRARERRSRRKNRGGGSQLSVQDLIMLFQSMPTPNRGFRRPGGDQPDFLGGGLDQFYAKNPGIAQGADRAGQIAAERKQQLSRGFEDGRAAVDFAKQTKGYTDAQGNFVPPTMPTAPSSAYGTGSVSFTDKPTRGTMTDPLTGKQVFMDEYLPQQSIVQDTKYGAMPGQGGGGALARPRVQQLVAKAAQPQNDMTALFPGKPVSVSAGIEGRLNPRQQVPRGRQDYIFDDPVTGYPTSGSLGQKELARRATLGLIPAMGAKITSAPAALGNALTSAGEFLFGSDQAPEPLPERSAADMAFPMDLVFPGAQGQARSPMIKSSSPMAPLGLSSQETSEQIVRMAFKEGLPPQEIAARMGTTPDEVQRAIRIAFMSR